MERVRERVKALRVNKGVVWIKVGYSLWGLGLLCVMPYVPLQMASLGLSTQDISLILGLMPLLIVFFLPVSGLVGDMFGYKYVLMLDIIVSSLAFTSFHYVPRYSEGHVKIPFVNISSEDNYLVSVQWAVCDGVGNVDVTGVEACALSWPVTSQPSFLANLSLSLHCQGESSIIMPEKLQFNNVTETVNGTFCQLALNSTFSKEGKNATYTCSIDDSLLPGDCDSSEGSWAVTFWLMFALSFLFKMQINSGFAILDGVSVREAAKHNSKYSYIIFYSILAQALSPFISGWTIKDLGDGTSDYSLMYYVADAIMLLSMIVILWKVNVKVEKSSSNSSGLSGLKALPKLLSVPSLVLALGVAATGLQWGMHDTFLYLYLQRDLGASSTLLARLSTIGFVSQALLLPFSEKLIQFTGVANAIVINLAVEAGRFLIYSWMQVSPPAYAMYLHALDFTMWSFSWVAMINYGYQITPPTLVATMSSILALLEFILFKSLASLIGGQLISKLGLSLPELFRVTAFFTLGIGALYYFLYYFIARRREKSIIEELDRSYPERLSKPKSLCTTTQAFIGWDMGTKTTSF